VDHYYFDHNATTPVSLEVLEGLIPVFRDVYGNASSIHHYGQVAKQHLEMARRETSALIGADPREIVFLSGGTEADNLAILGAVRHSAKPQKHVITTAIEHPAVLSTCAQLEREGVEVTYVRTGGDGVVDPDDVRAALRPETVLISVMHANNELGTIQPVEEISRVAREAGVIMHSDGVQALGKLPVDVNRLGVDLYSMSGHKIYGPKGIGALFVRKGTRLSPILFGGHHERDRRPGTENVPDAAAFGLAAGWLQTNLDTEATRVRVLRDHLEQAILERVPQVFVNGRNGDRTPNTTNICFEGLEGEAMVIALDLKGFAVSTGAACSSGAVEPSHVLTAIGLAPEKAKASLRFSLGRSNTIDHVDALVDAVVATVEHLRRLSPAYIAHE
jgi:cysteine desulfurase